MEFPSLIQQYQKLLNTQKQIIKTNIYMQELEKTYSKPRHRTNLYLTRKPTDLRRSPHHWPIESGIFTKILQKKLRSELSPATKNYFKSKCRISLNSKTRVHNYSKLKLRPLVSNKSFLNDTEKSLESVISLRGPEKVKRHISESPSF